MLTLENECRTFLRNVGGPFILSLNVLYLKERNSELHRYKLAA